MERLLSIFLLLEAGVAYATYDQFTWPTQLTQVPYPSYGGIHDEHSDMKVPPEFWTDHRRMVFHCGNGVSQLPVHQMDHRRKKRATVVRRAEILGNRALRKIERFFRRLGLQPVFTVEQGRARAVLDADWGIERGRRGEPHFYIRDRNARY